MTRLDIFLAARAAALASIGLPNQGDLAMDQFALSSFSSPVGVVGGTETIPDAEWPYFRKEFYDGRGLFKGLKGQTIEAPTETAKA